MSETTSPKATIFPTFFLPTLYLVFHRLDLYLAQSPYLLFGVPGLSQGSYDVELEIGDVTRHQAGLPRPIWNHPHLAYRGGQDAALGASERLGTALVLQLYRSFSDVREREKSPRVRRLRAGLCKRPAFEGEVRAGAAQDVPVGVALEHESRVRTGQVVRLQLVEGGLYVGVPSLFVQAVAVEVEGHDELAQVRGLLDLQDQGIRPEGVQDPAGHVYGVAGPNSVARRDGVVVLRLERRDEILSRAVLLDPDEYRRVVGRREDVPRLRLAVGFAVLFPCCLLVGVQVDGQHVGGVEELDQEREVRPAPALTDQLIRELLDELVERAPLVGTVGDRTYRLAVVADLPGLRHHAVWRVLLAEHLGDQTLPEVVIAHVVTQLDRVGVHGPSPYPLTL